MRLARIILFVRNVAEVAEFYQKFFAMEPQPGASADWVELAGPGGNIAVHKAHGGAHPGPASPVKIVFYCDNIEAAKQSFSEQGLVFGKTHSYGELQFADAVDPAGNPIQISNR
ncbi:MAG: VOC family protein [Chthonomonas sp.]|nr:VOC family protein [Chthonomonas sp.]